MIGTEREAYAPLGFKDQDNWQVTKRSDWKDKRSDWTPLMGAAFLLPFFGLALAIIIAYQAVWHAGFIWDDDFHLTNNPCIVGPLGFKGIWTTTAATYYPLVLSSFWVQHALWGLQPLPYHLVNVAMHAACAILLWQVLRRLHVRGAWFGAALWALHPVQVESVAWITELKNTQSCLFYLLSILFFLRWQESGSPTKDRHTVTRRWSYAVALLCALGAILSKSSTVMLPVVLGLCVWWQGSRWHWRNIRTLIPFVLVSALAAGWTIWEQKFHSGAVGQTWTHTWLERLIISGRAVWFYLGKLLWPHPLVFIYPRWQIDASQPLAYLPTLAAVAGLLVLWWKRNGWLRPVFFGAAYFVVSLFPVLGFFDAYFFRYSFVGDHLQYLASMGPLVLFAAGIAKAESFIPAAKNLFYRIITCSAVLVVLAALTWNQCAMYRDIETLWKTTIRKDPHSWIARHNLGSALLLKGRFDEALVYFQQALHEDPNQVEVFNSMGYALLRMRRINEAFPYFQKALEMEPNRPDVLCNLADAWLQTGYIDEATVYLERILKSHPTYVPALSDFGLICLQRGRTEESMAYLQKALRLAPNFGPAHLYLASALLRSRRPDEAIVELQHVLRSDPNNTEALRDLAWVLATWPDARIRDGPKAVELAERANKLDQGRDPFISITLAAAYAEAGRFSDAINTAEAALQAANYSGNATSAERIRAYIGLYRLGQAFRDVR